MTDPIEPTEDAIVEARVAAGAQWLDEQLPGWADKVDLEQLNMSSPFWCVLGQLAPDLLGTPRDDWMRADYLDAVRRYGSENDKAVREAWAIGHGFYLASSDLVDLSDVHQTYVDLGYVDAWTAEITKRASVTPPEGAATVAA